MSAPWVGFVCGLIIGALAVLLSLALYVAVKRHGEHTDGLIRPVPAKKPQGAGY